MRVRDDMYRLLLLILHCWNGFFVDVSVETIVMRLRDIVNISITLSFMSMIDVYIGF